MNRVLLSFCPFSSRNTANLDKKRQSLKTIRLSIPLFDFFNLLKKDFGTFSNQNPLYIYHHSNPSNFLALSSVDVNMSPKMLCILLSSSSSPNSFIF